VSDVRLDVGGRTYTVSCADGQEDNVRRLARMVDDKLASMRANLSTNEAKNLLFAALLLADELDEAKEEPSMPPQPVFDTERLAAQLEHIAGALENAASTLEGGAQGS
jgi:cell division protein ZapA